MSASRKNRKGHRQLADYSPAGARALANPEILECVIASMPREDLSFSLPTVKSMRLVCKTWKATMEPYLVEDVAFSGGLMRSYCCEHVAIKVSHLLNQTPTLHSYIRRLHLADAAVQAHHMHFLGKCTRLVDLLVVACSIKSMALLYPQFPTSLSWLRNLDFFLESREMRDDSSRKAINDFLRALPRLLNIRCRLDPHESQADLPSFHLGEIFAGICHKSAGLRLNCTQLSRCRELDLAKVLQPFTSLQRLEIWLWDGNNLPNLVGIVPPTLKDLCVLANRVTLEGILSDLADPSQLPHLNEVPTLEGFSHLPIELVECAIAGLAKREGIVDLDSRTVDLYRMTNRDESDDDTS